MSASPFSPDPLTTVLERVQSGAPGAEEELIDLVYRELHLMASAQLRGNRRRSLRPTALVNEAYLRLFGDRENDWANRRHFFMAAARAMRDVLVERARRADALKRGGHLVEIEFEENSIGEYESQDLLDLDGALAKLEHLDPVSAELVTLRFYGGLTHHQAARVMHMSRATAERRWEFARAWLKRTLARGA